MVLTPYDLFSWNKQSINSDFIDKLTTFKHTRNRASENAHSVHAGSSYLVTPGSSFLLPPAPCCLLPCWELTAFLPPCLGGLALPYPPFSELTPFPSGSRQRPILVWGTRILEPYAKLREELNFVSSGSAFLKQGLTTTYTTFRWFLHHVTSFKRCLIGNDNSTWAWLFATWLPLRYSNVNFTQEV